MNYNKVISIAILCIENKGVKTEKYYFDSKDKIKKGMKYSKTTLEKLGIKNLMFRSVDFNFNDSEIESWFKSMQSVQPNVVKLFVLCDRDTNFPQVEIDKRFERIKAIPKKIIKNKKKKELFNGNIFLLKYKNNLEKFESFLVLHNEIKNYSKQVRGIASANNKNDPHVFQKYMGKNCENFDILIRNIEVRQPSFLQLFQDHSK